MKKDDKTVIDSVMEEAIRMNQGVMDAMKEMLPRPPGTRKLTQDEQLTKYLALTPADMQRMRQERGDAAMEYYIGSMEALRRRRLGGA